MYIIKTYIYECTCFVRSKNLDEHREKERELNVRKRERERERELNVRKRERENLKSI